MRGNHRTASDQAGAAHEDDASLATPMSRAALRTRRKPYWRALDTGRHLGYYKGARSSTWHARLFVGAGRYEEILLGKADDSVDADGHTVLDYSQAVARSHEWWASKGHGVSGGVAGQPGLRNRPKKRVQTDRLDEVALAWARERPDLDLSLVGLFLRIKQAHYMHERRLTAISQAVGVDVGELHVLLALRRAGAPYAMRPTELFKSLLVTSGAMSKRIDRLERMKLVARAADPEDLRASNIVLTDAGVAAADDAMVRIADGLTVLRAAIGMSDDQFSEADSYLRRIISVNI
ncbi:MarR family winged helix-turn-helix transcriptional regulator [Paraburkholderia rhizosphaerae]|uniref:DNA-binding MarR family transcriptional regulator n=1 Tax=Paraburkholderia rhizosphaerae TaxID=480658 RepID=A0A4R8LGE7_9BURK|nr:MarR family transcriptional regulator [Paraburkholderia rhizosphaerae]TDY42216.1 DNA-binding MarR family transcriptional regulator [Paraburkholderia rhizosphaerae]